MQNSITNTTIIKTGAFTSSKIASNDVVIVVRNRQRAVDVHTKMRPLKSSLHRLPACVNYDTRPTRYLSSKTNYNHIHTFCLSPAARGRYLLPLVNLRNSFFTSEIKIQTRRYDGKRPGAWLSSVIMQLPWQQLLRWPGDTPAGRR